MPSFVITLDPAILNDAAERGESVEITLRLRPESMGPEAGQPIVRPKGPLASLLQTGRLTPGQRLTFSQPRANRTAVALVRADGGLEVDGKVGVFWSPSKAAGAVTGSQINGWTLWRDDDGTTLDELRAETDND